MNPTYTAVATASGRESRAITADGQLDVQLAFPKEMGGTGDGINPEQLFAVGWAACFSTSLDRVAQARGIDASDIAVTAEVSLVPADGRFELAAVLRVELPDHLHGDPGNKLLEATEAVCPYSRAVQGNISVQIVTE